MVETREQEARIGDNARPPLEPDRNAVGLEDRQNDGEIAGVLVQRLAPRLALFLDRLELRDHRTQQLDDDRGRDIGHDVEREHRHALHRAAREHVEHVEHALLLARKRSLEGGGVDAGNGDVRAEPDDDQRAEREPDAFLQLFGLAERCPIYARRELFGRRCHINAPQILLARAELSGHMACRKPNVTPFPARTENPDRIRSNQDAACTWGLPNILNSTRLEPRGPIVNKTGTFVKKSSAQSSPRLPDRAVRNSQIAAAAIRNEPDRQAAPPPLVQGTVPRFIRQGAQSHSPAALEHTDVRGLRALSRRERGRRRDLPQADGVVCGRQRLHAAAELFDRLERAFRRAVDLEIRLGLEFALAENLYAVARAPYRRRPRSALRP